MVGLLLLLAAASLVLTIAAFSSLTTCVNKLDLRQQAGRQVEDTTTCVSKLDGRVGLLVWFDYYYLIYLYYL